MSGKRGRGARVDLAFAEPKILTESLRNEIWVRHPPRLHDSLTLEIATTLGKMIGEKQIWQRDAVWEEYGMPNPPMTGRG